MQGDTIPKFVDTEINQDLYSRFRVLRRFRPLVFIDNDTLLGSEGYVLRTYSISEDRYTKVAVAGTLRKRLMSKSRYLSRVLRLGFRHAIEATEGIFILRLGKEIFRLELENGKIEKEQVAEQFFAPLSFGRIEDVEGFQNQVVFGEYFHNPHLKPVGLFSWTQEFGWNKAYEFPAQTINHVHSILPDRKRNGVWILAGDFGDSASIWFATNDFSKVECVANGSQEVRACFGHPTSKGLYICTDSPLENNYFSILEKKLGEKTWAAEKRCAINGPVIFHGRCKTGVVFSTTVEPMPNPDTIFWSVLSRERGPGVLTKYSSIWHLSHDGELTELSRNEKDMLPYLFQFGMCTFPENGDRSEFLVSFNIALKRNDYCTEIWKPNASRTIKKDSNHGK